MVHSLSLESAGRGEDEVGKLQSPRRPHPAKHGLVKKPRDLLEYVIVHEMFICSSRRTVNGSSAF
jgi:hypothetical protein